MKRTRREGKKKRARRGDGACSPVIIVARVTFGRSRFSTRAAVRLSFPLKGTTAGDHLSALDRSAPLDASSRAIGARSSGFRFQAPFNRAPVLKPKPNPAPRSRRAETNGAERVTDVRARRSRPRRYFPRGSAFSVKSATETREFPPVGRGNIGVETESTGRDSRIETRALKPDAYPKRRRFSRRRGKSAPNWHFLRSITVRRASKNLPVDWHFFPHCRAYDRPPTAVAKAWKIEISSARSSSLLRPVDRVR